MYLPYLLFGYTATLALVLLGCWLILRTTPGLRGIRELGCAIVTGMVGAALGATRPWTPAFVAILVGNYVLLAAFALMYWTLARVLQAGMGFLVWIAALYIASLPVFCYALWVHPDIVLRIWLVSAMSAFVCGGMAVLLLRHNSPRLHLTTRVLGGLQLCMVLFHGVRSVLSGLHPPKDFIHPDWLQTTFTYVQFVWGLAFCCGIVWLSLYENRAELEEMALTDGLTGLLNRRAFDDILIREMQRSKIADETVGLILLDLDHFKQLNDTYGHGVGDEALRVVSRILKQMTRPGDTLTRYGGEEFALLVRNAGLEETQAIAERLREAIEQCVAPGDAVSAGLRLTASVGIAMVRQDEDPATFVERCDRALYASKQAGRNLVTICAP